jgi:two-component system, sporulation sensor kinase E
MHGPGRVKAASSVTPPAILVVDDEPVQRLAIRAMLSPLGHAVTAVDCGRDAVRAVERQRFALILMDVRMPTLDGYETARLIRQRTEAPSTPIMFVTASGEEHPRGTEIAYASGAVDFILTPVRPDVLRLKVSTYVDLFVQARELERSREANSVLDVALHESEARAHAVLQNVVDGIVTFDEQGLIESSNRSAQRLFGYSEDEVIGQPVGLLLMAGEDDHVEAFTRAVSGGLTGQEICSGPVGTVGRRKDGSCFPIEVETSQMALGERTLALDSIRDVSERQAHTEALGHRACGYRWVRRGPVRSQVCGSCLGTSLGRPRRGSRRCRCRGR